MICSMIAGNFLKGWRIFKIFFSFVICTYTLGYTVKCEISEETNIYGSWFDNIERQIPWNSIRFKIMVWGPSE